MAAQATVTAYLQRLGWLDTVATPSLEVLKALHRSHVERVAYETLDIQLGQVVSIDPLDSVRRIVKRHRGGYCYHLNGAFAWLLTHLGFRVMRHRAGVQNRKESTPPGAQWANHLTLTVHGLECEPAPQGVWLVDVGLGDALHDPIPLQPGTFQQGTFTYRLRPSEVEPGGWRFDHDPSGSFAGMDFQLQPAAISDFSDRHHYLSTSPHSGFVRTSCVLRRDADGIDSLTGCVLERTGTKTMHRIVDTATEWFEALADVFNLPLLDLDLATRRRLWDQVWRTHNVWLAKQNAPPDVGNADAHRLGDAAIGRKKSSSSSQFGLSPCG